MRAAHHTQSVLADRSTATSKLTDGNREHRKTTENTEKETENTHRESTEK